MGRCTGHVTTATFDAAGNQLSLRDPNSIGWNATYDARNRAVTMADTQEQAESKNRQTTYDAHGNVVGTTDAKGQSASSAFDARDRRVSETDRLAGVTTWRFDENSNLRHRTDAENQSPYKPTAWSYDARNLKLNEALPGHNPTSQIGDADFDKKEFAYDLAGRVEVATDQKGNNVTHLYDLASRLLQRDYRLFNQTAIGDSDAFTYGDAGRMTSAESARYNNTVAFGYDAAGRLTSESLTVTFGQTTTYTVQSAYDAANRRTGMTYPDGSVVARQYTARDQLAQIDYNSAMVATFAYDPGLRRTSRTLGDTPGTQTAWVYGRQDDLPTAINSAIPGASFTYTYDANKNKLTEGISAPMANFGFNSTTYDQADRLTAWNRTDGNLDQAWDLSLVGNWATFTENQLQQTRTHTAVHEIAVIDASPIAHDPAGNLTRNAGDTLDRYMWDLDNRLGMADVDQDGTPECLYRHDALGRRVSKTVPDGEGSATTVFLGTIQALAYSPHAMQVVAEYPADAAPASPARKFIYAEYIDEPVMMLATSGATTTSYYYHQTSLYSVAALTDAIGTVVERYAYSAYGKPLFLDAAATPLDPQASTIGNPYLFTGRRLDEETGLYYYRARMYDAELGRFVSRDPIGYEGADVSLYRYVFNSPMTATDPRGYQAGQATPALAAEALKAQMVNACSHYHNTTLRFDQRVAGCFGAIVHRATQLEAQGHKELAQKCRSVTFECICCADHNIDPRAGGAYDPNTHRILMCAENPQMRGGDQFRAARRLCHEMIHVLQGPSCHPSPWPQSCVNTVAEEVEAYYCTGQCTSPRRCLDLAIDSAQIGGGCKKEKGEPTKEQYEGALKWTIEAIRRGGLCPAGIGPGMFRGAGQR